MAIDIVSHKKPPVRILCFAGTVLGRNLFYYIVLRGFFNRIGEKWEACIGEKWEACMSLGRSSPDSLPQKHKSRLLFAARFCAVYVLLIQLSAMEEKTKLTGGRQFYGQKKHHGICAFKTKDEITVDILLAKLYNL